MFNHPSNFDQAFEHAPDGGTPLLHVDPLLRKKTWKQWLNFWGANALVMPFVLLCCLTIGAEGLRTLMGVMSTRLYKMPIPGAGMLRYYDGWNRLDAAILMSFLLFMAVTVLWYRGFRIMMVSGNFMHQRDRNPILFYLLCFVASIIVLGDSALFYYGLASKATSSWGETSNLVPIGATIIYMAILALIGAWHADHASSGAV